MNNLLHCLSFLIFFSLKVHSQYDIDQSIEVIKNNVLKTMPWAGGLNHVQISDFDYDFDGDLDLFIFDITSNNIRVYTQNQSSGTPFYEFEYNAKNNFPSDIYYRGVMVDYDNDGKKDLWTHGLGGLKVYRNVGDIVNGLQWQLEKELIYSEYVSSVSPLVVSSFDMPAISDIDNDGDIDILTFDQSGATVEYHQNQSMELYGIPDSLVFELKNECWGLFREGNSTNDITLNDPFSPCVGGAIPNPETSSFNTKLHAGSSILALDMNNSGVKDLIIGDASFANLVLLINGGSTPNTNSAMISMDVNFPSNNTPLDLQIFPVAFFVDVDFDNIKDLVVSNNVRNLAENEESIWFYKNLGSNNSPNFSFQKNNLFQDDMIEHGSGSIPVLFDENEDGLQDLLVANLFRYIPNLDKESTLALYRNSGNVNQPQFSYIDFDYLNFSQEFNSFRLVPTFGDMDNDGDQDMLVGQANGTITYFENESIGNGAIFNTPQHNFTDNLGATIDPGDYSYPQLFDLNKDSLIDLIIGVRTGELYYYQNIGTNISPSFELTNTALGQVDVSGTEVNGYAAPHFYNKNDTTYLLSGAFDGYLHFYNNIEDNLDPGDSFTLISNQYAGINVDGYSSVALNDLNNDGKLNLIVGQELGGLHSFIENGSNNASINELNRNMLVSIYPNPANSNFNISANSGEILSIKLIDFLGKILFQKQVNKRKIWIDSSSLTPGVYIVEIYHSSGNIIQKRISIQ